jgi:cell division protein FtsB
MYTGGSRNFNQGYGQQRMGRPGGGGGRDGHGFQDRSSEDDDQQFPAWARNERMQRPPPQSRGPPPFAGQRVDPGLGGGGGAYGGFVPPPPQSSSGRGSGRPVPFMDPERARRQRAELARQKQRQELQQAQEHRRSERLQSRLLDQSQYGLDDDVDAGIVPVDDLDGAASLPDSVDLPPPKEDKMSTERTRALLVRVGKQDKQIDEQRAELGKLAAEVAKLTTALAAKLPGGAGAGVDAATIEQLRARLANCEAQDHFYGITKFATPYYKAVPTVGGANEQLGVLPEGTRVRFAFPYHNGLNLSQLGIDTGPASAAGPSAPAARSDKTEGIWAKVSMIKEVSATPISAFILIYDYNIARHQLTGYSPLPIPASS